MYKMSLPWVVWLMLGPSLVADASPQFPTDIVTKTLEFLKGDNPSTPSPTVCNCMGETSDTLVNWQNPDFPKNESLPGICTLTLKPPEGTCAYRLNFDNLDLSDKEFSYGTFLSAFSCPIYNPYIMVSSVNYTAPARCQNLTGYEGVVQLPEKSTEPVVILLKTIPGSNFTFRVNISAVPCADIKSFKSPSNCGIKNQEFSSSSKKNLRSDRLSQDATLKKIESVEESRSSRQLSDEPLAEPETDDSQAKNQDDSTSNNPVYRRLPVEQQKKKKKKQEKEKSQAKPEKKVEIGDDAREFAEKLKGAGNIISYGLGVSIEQGKVEYKPNKNNRIVGTTTILNEYPWMVYIEYAIVAIIPFFGRLEIPLGCSGTLLDDSHVITQASCLPGVRNTSLAKLLGATPGDPIEVNFGSLESVRVILGDHDVSDPTDTESLNVTISKVTFPMTFSSIGVKDDIAVLTLSEPVEFSKNVKPVCFPVSYNKFTDDIGILAGWPQNGLINDPSDIISTGIGIAPPPGFGSSVPKLNEIDVIVLDKSECKDFVGLVEEGLLSLVTRKTSIKADDYVCLTNRDFVFECDVGLGTPLVRQDQTNAHFLYGISSIFQTCSTLFPSVFTAIKPDDPFLNLVLT